MSARPVLCAARRKGTAASATASPYAAGGVDGHPTPQGDESIDEGKDDVDDGRGKGRAAARDDGAERAERGTPLRMDDKSCEPIAPSPSPSALPPLALVARAELNGLRKGAANVVCRESPPPLPCPPPIVGALVEAACPAKLLAPPLCARGEEALGGGAAATVRAVG